MIENDCQNSYAKHHGSVPENNLLTCDVGSGSEETEPHSRKVELLLFQSPVQWSPSDILIHDRNPK